MSEIEVRPSGIELIRSLEKAGLITDVAMDLSSADLSYDEFEAVGAMMGALKRRTSFYLGDWMIHGERTWEERMEQAKSFTGLSFHSLENMASVCRRVPPQVRRAKVPFSTHAEVTALDPVDQDRWLRKAEENEWTKMALREEIRGLPLGGSSPIVEPAANLEQIARDLVNAAKQYGADGFLVPRHAFTALALALGENV